jgi:hypothetical protein
LFITQLVLHPDALLDNTAACSWAQVQILILPARHMRRSALSQARVGAGGGRVKSGWGRQNQERYRNLSALSEFNRGFRPGPCWTCQANCRITHPAMRYLPTDPDGIDAGAPRHAPHTSGIAAFSSGDYRRLAEECFVLAAVAKDPDASRKLASEGERYLRSEARIDHDGSGIQRRAR